ncbi:hypothetical protein BJ508DRAFT_335286 [Ascobolus immersus RN42]|uniref:CCHC-type domain-containing protein n=1 Tax=Ascobolus immersus RN42 TaxID=1160509 RepID=A0A3N4HJR9_ASCIM|nr:hypothetical protein BJ508DRAFT_335286 [Ascobolus immersus RN42]
MITHLPAPQQTLVRVQGELLAFEIQDKMRKQTIGGNSTVSATKDTTSAFSAQASNSLKRKASNPKPSGRKGRCDFCKTLGHWEEDCRKKKKKHKSGTSVTKCTYYDNLCHEESNCKNKQRDRKKYLEERNDSKGKGANTGTQGNSATVNPRITEVQDDYFSNVSGTSNQ